MTRKATETVNAIASPRVKAVFPRRTRTGFQTAMNEVPRMKMIRISVGPILP